MKEKFLKTFQNFICYLIYHRNWTWLELIIEILCTFEINLKLIKDQDYREMVDYADYSLNGTSNADEFIPKNTMYCEDCIYKSKSKIAEFFYGYQCSGYCYYLGKGDFSIINPTEILWDGCKECGKFEYDPDEDLI